MDVPCFYNPNNRRHSLVTTAINGKAVFSVAGELFVGKKMIQIVSKEIPTSRKQFPIQNAFALTVHKTQGFALPRSTVSIDDDMFAPGQIYVAMSRAPSWNSINILSFDFDCIKVDRHVISEYRRLNLLNQKGLKELM